MRTRVSKSARRRCEASERRRTVAKGDERPQRVEDDARVDDAVVVQLAEVLDGRDALLVVLEVVDLHAGAHVLEHIVDDADAEVGVVPAEVVQEDGEQVHVAVLDLPDLGEGVVELADDLQGTARARVSEMRACGSEKRGADARRGLPSGACAAA